jgi:hypothetical protein
MGEIAREFDFDGSPNRPQATFAASRRDFQTLAESFRVSLGFLWKIGLQIQSTNSREKMATAVDLWWRIRLATSISSKQGASK